MRGTLCRCGLSTRRIGIIPAYAGNTVSARMLRHSARDHPRICGEHLLHCCLLLSLWGSSPHMRGTPSHVPVYAYLIGIIPAYAGNTYPWQQRTPVLRDHPRICGEHVLGSDDHVSGTGSSPHMRGTLKTGFSTIGSGGIIPAYAGNTAWIGIRAGSTVDHPRICGEHSAASCICSSSSGSSPHMRGTRSAGANSSWRRGIIPAYAGNTVSPPMGTRPRQDHPRICGEHVMCLCFLPPSVGSSPHMRGTLNPHVQLRPQSGIIPAYAGNTSSQCNGMSLSWDHPRICGEHSNSMGAITTIAGSSPHMRGTHLLRLIRNDRTGIIPAYAGNTA